MPVIGHAANNGHLSFIYKLGQDEFEIKSLYRLRLKCHDIRKRWQRKRAGIKLFAKCIFYEFIR